MDFRHPITLSGLELHPLTAVGGVSPNMALGQMPVRPALLVKLIDTEGCFGWGEIWANFPPRAHTHKAHLVEDVVVRELTDLRFSTPLELTEHLRTRLATYFLHIGQQAVFEHILAGLDTAAWDLCLRASGQSFSDFMGVEPRAECYASSLNPNDLGKRLHDHGALGQTEFKLKIGFTLEDDCAFVARAAEQKPEGARLMIDSNQRWDVNQAQDMLARLEPFDLLFAEESIPADAPLASWEALARHSKTPLAGGENLYGVEQFLAMANAGVRFLQPDVAKWGGVTGALELARALPEGTRLWPHFMGSEIGQQAALAVSAAIGAGSKCEMDVNENALRTALCGGAGEPIENGTVALMTEPGLVRPPKSEHLITHRAAEAA
jgi:L-alanine-DL-glutamate epimerase-like enolase superfamily enzyme